MVLKWIVPILVIANVHCDANNELHKHRRSLSPTKVSRFNILSGKYEEQNSPENYFPDIEFPSNILDVAKPFYFRASEDSVLDPFPRDVKNSFKSISHADENAKSSVKQNIEVETTVLGLKSDGNIAKTSHVKNKTDDVIVIKENSSNEFVDTEINDSGLENRNTSNLEIDITEKCPRHSFGWEESSEGIENDTIVSGIHNNTEENISSSTEEVFMVPLANLTDHSLEAAENIESNNSSEELNKEEVTNSTEQTSDSSRASKSDEIIETQQKSEEKLASTSSEEVIDQIATNVK